MLSAGLNIDIKGIGFTAFAERALYWDRPKILMIADLHLGKGDIFRASGIPVPNQVQHEDLARLDNLLKNLRPKVLVILGDLVHGRLISQSTLNLWESIRSNHRNTKFILTRGNHDRNNSQILSLVDVVVKELKVDRVIMTHQALDPCCELLNINGHIHPIFRIKWIHRGFPAMVYEKNRLSLPAFSQFTSGVEMHSKDSQVWIFVDTEKVLKV